MYKDKKYFFPWQVKKELKYLDSMARKGYLLEEKKLLTYIFKEDKKEMRYHAIAIQLEQENNAKHPNMKYITGYASSQYYYTTNIKKRLIHQKEYQKLFVQLGIFLLIVAVPLYYVILFYFPNLSDQELQQFTFQKILQIVTYIIVVLHGYIILRITSLFIRYKRLKK